MENDLLSDSTKGFVLIAGIIAPATPSLLPLHPVVHD